MKLCSTQCVPACSYLWPHPAIDFTEHFFILLLKVSIIKINFLSQRNWILILICALPSFLLLCEHKIRVQVLFHLTVRQSHIKHFVRLLCLSRKYFCLSSTERLLIDRPYFFRFSSSSASFPVLVFKAVFLSFPFLTSLELLYSCCTAGNFVCFLVYHNCPIEASSTYTCMRNGLAFSILLSNCSCRSVFVFKKWIKTI